MEELAKLLPYDQPGKLLEVLVTWGRYAEILDYDENTRTLSLKVEEPAEAEESESENRE